MKMGGSSQKSHSASVCFEKGDSEWGVRRQSSYEAS